MKTPTCLPGFILTAALSLAMVFASPPSYAYIGPGAGLSAIGSALALLGGLLLAVVGFLWYPLKRLFRKRQQPGTTSERADG